MAELFTGAAVLSGVTGRVQALDGIRGIAVILVLAAHFNNMAVMPERSLWARWLGDVLSWGWSGVDLFFVLSGFLITGILLDARSKDGRYAWFYRRRAARIFPLYYGVVMLSIAASVVLRYWFPQKMIGPSTIGWIAFLAYVQNWWLPLADLHHMQFLGPFWSLGVEEQFYLVWPVIVWRTSRKTISSLCVGGILLALLLRWWLVPQVGSTVTYFVYMNTLTRMDGVLTGAICAIIVRNAGSLARTRRVMPLAAISIGFGLVVSVARGRLAWNDREVLVYDHLLLTLGFAILVVWACLVDGEDNLFGRVLRWSGLRAFGKYSYGIYVYQGALLELTLYLFRRRSWWGHSGSWGMAVAIGWISVPFALAFVSYHLYEKHFLRLR